MAIKQFENPFVAALFAAERIAKAGKLDNIHIAGSEAKVSTSDLAPKIVAFALLQLRDQGAITMKAASKKVLFVTTNWVELHRTGTPAAGNGVAAALLSRVVDGKSAKDAVYAWYQRDFANPWPMPIKVATGDAIDAGYLVEVQQGLGGKIGSVFSGSVPTAIVSGKEDEVRAIADAAAAAWQAYAAQDAALLELLVKQCSAAISSRTEQTNLNDN